MQVTFDINKIRQDFPILDSTISGKRLTYLDSAATAQKPITVIDRMKQFMLEENATVRRGVYDLSANSTQAFDEVRIQVQKFINAKYSEEIIFTRGTTESLNLVASSLCRHLGQDLGILVSGLEHHANIVPWQLQNGMQLKSIPVLDSGDLDLEAYAKIIKSGQIQILALTHISNAIGTINPIKEMIALAHKHNVIVVIDGAQGVTHSIVDVQDLDCDFYCFSAHKLYGPTGVGVLYGKKELLEKLPPYHGGGEMIERVSFTNTTFAGLPFKFEAGTPPIVEVIGLGAALSYLDNIGMTNIIQHETDLLNYTLEKSKVLPGLKIIGNPRHRGALISFVFDDIGSFDIGTLMNEHGVAIRTGHHCAQPVMARFGIDSSSRISLGLYNNREDIDRCFAALEQVVKIFR